MQGYLSLAQANFSNQSRIRYGQDYYDERMQASSTVWVLGPQEMFSSQCTLSCSLFPCRSIEAGTSPSFAISAPLSLESPVRSDLEENEPLHSSKETPDSAGENIAANSESKVAKKSPRDPLDWFGILVPPTLRTSQGKFRAAVTGNIPALANVVKDMRELEIEVGRTRKKMRKAS